MSVLDDAPLAVYRRREPGQVRIVELQAGNPEAGQAALLVAFKVPDGVQLAYAEAQAQEAMGNLARSPELMARYALADRALKDAEIFALGKVVVAIETAIALWTDWNYGVEPAEGEAPAKAELSPEAISRLLLDDQDIRAAWTIHLDAASPLERAEGNVSAVSPNGTSGEAANTAQGADAPQSPAPEA